MFAQSGVMAMLGMGTVFGFLVIMIIAVTLTGKIIHAIGVDKEVQQGGSAAVKTENDSSVTAAISAAVNEYRKNN